MSKGVVIYTSPFTLHKGTDEQEQCALRLMEIGDEDIDDMILEAWGDDNLCGRMKSLARVAVEIIAYLAQSIDGVEWGSALGGKSLGIIVWLPLTHMQLLFGEIGIVVDYIFNLLI